MDEADVIPAAQARVADRLADANNAAIGLENHQDIAAAVAVMQNTLARLADALAAAGRGGEDRTMTEAVEPSTVSETPRPIVARAGRYYRNARYIMILVGVVMGAWFLYDGFVGYPEKNRQIDENDAALAAITDKNSPEWYERQAKQTKLKTKHSDTDIALQKVLGFSVPAVALAYLFYVIKKSRGEIRLENDVLTVPGHPPVPLTAVKSVDAKLWKKKGIAYVKYDVNGTAGEITLDDFVYEQTPIDAIYDRLVAVNTPVDAAAVPSPGTPGRGRGGGLPSSEVICRLRRPPPQPSPGVPGEGVRAPAPSPGFRLSAGPVRLRRPPRRPVPTRSAGVRAFRSGADHCRA